MPVQSTYDPLSPTPYQPQPMPEQPPAPTPNIPNPSPFGGQPGFQFEGHGNISHAGAVAGVFDNILRGFVNGKAQGEAVKALKLKKTSDDLNASYTADAQNYWTVYQKQIAQGLNPNDPATWNTDEMKNATSRVNGSWSGIQAFRGGLLEQQEGKRKGKKMDRTPGEVLSDPNSSPQEKAQAMHDLSSKLGPPIIGQAQAWAAQMQQQQKSPEGQLATQKTTNALTHEQAQATYDKYAGWTDEQLKALSPEEQKKFANAKAIVTPPTKESGTTRQYVSPDGKKSGWYIPGYEPEGWNAYTKPEAGPKVGTLGEFLTAAYGPRPTPAQEVEGKKLWTQATSGTTVGEHVVMVPQRDGTITPVTVVTTSTKNFGSPGTAPSVRADQVPPAVIGAQPAPPAASAPLLVTQSFHGKSVPGMVEQGNVDLANRPNIDNGDGTHSSVFSMSFGTDKGEVLVPGVGDGKTYPLRKLTEQEALDQYKKTGQNFGTFKNVASADAYARRLHEDQAKYGNAPASNYAPTRRHKPSGTPPAASAPRGGAGVAHVGPAIGGRDTPAQAKATEDYNAAVKLNSLAVQALHSGNAGQQRQLALALIKGMAGRMNMQEYALYTKGYGVANTIEGLENMVTNGNLPKEVVKQLAKDAMANLIASKAAQKEAYSEPPSSTGAPQRPQNVPGTFIYFTASDGSGHWIDPANLAAAKRIDPHLQVVQ